MGWRGPAVIVALVAIGGAGGWAASGTTRDSSLGSGTAAPVAAEGPESPVRTTQPYAPDPDDPPLQPGIELAPTTAGSGRFEITFDAPLGWRSQANATNEWKWKQPGTSNNSYVMRIEQITSQDISVEDALAARIERLEDEQADFAPVARGADSLEYTYRSDENNARHSFMRWLDLDTDGQADIEMVVHGREDDVDGARDLIARVSASMRLG